MVVFEALGRHGDDRLGHALDHLGDVGLPGLRVGIPAVHPLRDGRGDLQRVGAVQVSVGRRGVEAVHPGGVLVGVLRWGGLQRVVHVDAEDHQDVRDLGDLRDDGVLAQVELGRRSHVNSGWRGESSEWSR